jgi:hypothetical protein
MILKREGAVSFAYSLSGFELRFTSVGLVSQSEWLGGLRAGLMAVGDGPARNLVFDCRAAADSRTADELREIVERIAKQRTALTDRCAVLVATEVCFGAARMMGVFLEPLGFEVLVTMNEAEADGFLHGLTPAGPSGVSPIATAGS